METCQNETCECQVSPGHTYCSSYCANVDQSETIPGYTNTAGGCACGHKDCHMALHSARAESKIGLGPNQGDA